MIQRWLVMEAAPLIDRADTIKLVINIRGGDVQPIVEARFDPL